MPLPISLPAPHWQCPGWGFSEPFQPWEPPHLSPAGHLVGRMGRVLGAAEHASLRSHRGARQRPWGLLLPLPGSCGGGCGPPQSSSPRSSMSPVQARGCLVGPPCQAGQGTPIPPKIRLGLRLHPSPTTTLARTRRGWEVGVPRSPSAGLAAVSPCAPGWPQAGAGAWPGCAVGGLAVGAWALGTSCPRLTACWGHRARGLPHACCCDGIRQSPPCGKSGTAEGAARPGLCPSVSSASGAAAAGLSEQPWGPYLAAALPLIPARGSPGLRRWGGGRRIAGARRGEPCRGLVLSPRALPAPPAVGHGARSRLERRSQPGRARLRQRLQAASRRALP